MSRVTVVRYRDGPIVRVCESPAAFDEWFERYGSKNYDRENLKVVSARVYESDDSAETFSDMVKESGDPSDLYDEHEGL